MSKKLKRILIVVIVLCVIVLGVDIFLFLKTDSKNLNFESLNSFFYDKDTIYACGSTNKNKDKKEEGVIYKYNSNLRKVNSYVLDSKYNSTFFYVKEDGNNLVAVGSIENTKDENKNKYRSALIAKYSKDGKLLFKKTYQDLGVSKFTNLIVADDGYIVVGQSIYPNDVLGNENTGGGMLIKYDKNGKILWKKHLGGNKSGLFNDIVKHGKYLYLAGKDATRYGVVAKYTLDGEYVKAVSYAKTDTIGFSSIEYKDGYLYVVGAKKLNEDDEYDHDIDGLIVKYDENLEKKDEVTYKDTKKGLERFNNLIIDGKDIYVVGHEAVLNKKKSTKKEFAYNYRGLINKYSLDLKLEDKNIYNKYSNNYFTDINKYNELYVVSGYNSNDTEKKYNNMFITYKGNLK